MIDNTVKNSLFLSFLVVGTFLSWKYGSFFFLLLFITISFASIYFGIERFQNIIPNIVKACLRKYLGMSDDELDEVMKGISHGQVSSEIEKGINGRFCDNDLNYIKAIPIENNKSGYILSTLWHYQKILDATFYVRFTYWEKNNNEFLNNTLRMNRVGIIGKDIISGQIFLTDVGIIFCRVNEEDLKKYPRQVFKSLDDRSNLVFSKTT